MTIGIIKTKTEKGFGFITVEGSDDVFFHHSACNGRYEELEIGQKVQFNVVKGDKGDKAEDVKPVSGNDDVAEAPMEDESMAA